MIQPEIAQQLARQLAASDFYNKIRAVGRHWYVSDSNGNWTNIKNSWLPRATLIQTIWEQLTPPQQRLMGTIHGDAMFWRWYRLITVAAEPPTPAAPAPSQPPN